MDDFKKAQFKEIGPGGIKCTCCNAYHSRKDFQGKKSYRRVARRRLSQQLPEVINVGGLIMTAEEYHFYFQINDYYDSGD